MSPRVDLPPTDGAPCEPYAGLDVVLARLAHAMRDTLHALAGHAELLATAPLAPEQHRHAAAIHARAVHLRELASEVLDGVGSARRAPSPAARTPGTSP